MSDTSYRRCLRTFLLPDRGPTTLYHSLFSRLAVKTMVRIAKEPDSYSNTLGHLFLSLCLVHEKHLRYAPGE